MKISIYTVLYFIFCCLFFPIQSLVELPATEDNNIAITESIIRRVLNNLFFTFKLKIPKKRPKIKHFSTVHKFFASITLQDQNNLREIARMAAKSEIDNKTQYFITQLNEVLNEDDNKNNETAQVTNDEYVIQYINIFVQKLKDLKDRLGFRNNAVDLSIHPDILKLLAVDNGVHNWTSQVEKEQKNQIGNGARRVFQGKKTSIKNYAFMASVQFFNKFMCAGSIIKSDLVITAASCLQLAWNNRFYRENPSFLSVRVGSDFSNLGGEVIQVLEVYFHPSYDPQTLKNNLAIMRLQRKIKFGKKNKYVKKIAFDKTAWGLPYNTHPITIVGWGARRISNMLDSPEKNRLSYAVVDVYPVRECQDVYSKEYVTQKNFCAGFISRGGGACNHDVGGPGISGHRLMGVISFGSPVCGAPDTPTVFTKLGFYTDWIEEIMEQDVPVAYKQTTRQILVPPYIYKVPEKTTKFQLSPVVSGNNNILHDTNIHTDDINATELLTKDIDTLRTIREDTKLKNMLIILFGPETVQKYIDTEIVKKHLRENLSLKQAGRLKSSSETIANINDDTNDAVIENHPIEQMSKMANIRNTIESLENSEPSTTQYQHKISIENEDIIYDSDYDNINSYNDENGRETDTTLRYTVLYNNLYDENEVSNKESYESDQKDKHTESSNITEYTGTNEDIDHHIKGLTSPYHYESKDEHINKDNSYKNSRLRTTSRSHKLIKVVETNDNDKGQHYYEDSDNNNKHTTYTSTLNDNIFKQYHNDNDENNSKVTTESGSKKYSPFVTSNLFNKMQYVYKVNHNNTDKENNGKTDKSLPKRFSKISNVDLAKTKDKNYKKVNDKDYDDDKKVDIETNGKEQIKIDVMELIDNLDVAKLLDLRKK